MEILVINKLYLIEQYGLNYLFVNWKEFFFFFNTSLNDFFEINSNFINFELSGLNYNIKRLDIVELKTSLPNWWWSINPNIWDYKNISFDVSVNKISKLFFYSNLDIKNFLYNYSLKNINEFKYNFIFDINNNFALNHYSFNNKLDKFSLFDISNFKIKFFKYLFNFYYFNYTFFLPIDTFYYFKLPVLGLKNFLIYFPEILNDFLVIFNILNKNNSNDFILLIESEDIFFKTFFRVFFFKFFLVYKDTFFVQSLLNIYIYSFNMISNIVFFFELFFISFFKNMVFSNIYYFLDFIFLNNNKFFIFDVKNDIFLTNSFYNYLQDYFKNNHNYNNKYLFFDYNLRYYFFLDFFFSNKLYDFLDYTIFEQNYDNFLYKIQPFFFRSGFDIENFKVIPTFTDYAFEKKSGICKKNDVILFFDQADTFFVKLLKKYFIINLEKKMNINLILFTESNIHTFFIFKMFSYIQIKKELFNFCLLFSFFLFFISFLKNYCFFIFIIIFKCIHIFLKFIYILLEYLLLSLEKKNKDTNWFFFFNNNIWKFYNNFIIHLNYLDLLKLWANVNLSNRSFIFKQNNLFLFRNILKLLKLLIIGLNMQIYFFFKNFNNFFLHNIQFYFYFKYWTHDHLLRSTPVISQFLDVLDFFKYLKYTISEHTLIVKILYYYKNYLNDKLKKKYKYNKYKIGLARKFTIFTTFLIYIDGIFGNIRTPYFFFRKENFLDKVLSLGRINTELEYLNLFYFAFEKEFFMFGENILSYLLHFNFFFYSGNKNILGQQKPIINLDYSILTFIFENKLNNDLILDNNKYMYLFNFKKLIYSFFLNNYLIYLFFFNYFNRFLKFEIYFKFFSFYFFNIFYFLYFLLLKKNIKVIYLNILKYLKFFYFIFLFFDLKFRTFIEVIIWKNKILFYFYKFIKSFLKFNLIFIFIFFMLNLTLVDLFTLINSLFILDIFDYIIYFYYFFFEFIKYMIEVVIIKNFFSLFSTIYFNILFENGIITNFFTNNIDYKNLFTIWGKVLLNNQVSFEVFYSELTFGKWSVWADLYIPTNFLHAFFRLIFLFLITNLQPYWLFFLKNWFFLYTNIYNGFFLILWYPVLKIFYQYWDIFDIFCLNIFIYLFKLYYFFEFFFNYFNILLLNTLMLLKILFNNIFIFVFYYLTFILLFFYFILGYVFLFLKFIYIFTFFYKFVNIIFEFLYSIFFIQIFFNFFTFLFNFFLFYSEKFYFNLNVDIIKSTMLSFRESYTGDVKNLHYFYDYGINLNENIWSQNIYDREIFLSFFLYEWKNLEFFKTFFPFFFEINKSMLFFFFIYIFVFYRIFLFFFSFINKWFFFFYFNNDFSLFFAPYLNWKNFSFFKKERSYYFTKDKNTILDLPLIYFFNSYNDLDNILYKKYEVLLYKNKKYELYKGRLRKMSQVGKKKYISNTLKIKTKSYISNKNYYPIHKFENIINNITNLKKINYFSFFIKSNYFFKNYQIFWYTYLNKFLLKTVDLHGSHMFYQLRKLHTWPLDLSMDKYNQLFGPVHVSYPFFDEHNRDYKYGYDLIIGKNWKSLILDSIDLKEKKHLLNFDLNYNLKTMLKDKKSLILKDILIKNYLIKPNKFLYFYNYLQYPFIYFFFNKDILSDSKLNDLKYIFPFLVPKSENIYNKYFILDKLFFDKYNMICLGSAFLSELKNFRFLKFIFFYTASQKYYFFNENNYKRSWVYENNSESLFFNQFYNLSKWSYTESVILPSIFQYNFINEFNKFMHINYKFYNWLTYLNVNYFNNYLNIYKLSTWKYNKDYGNTNEFSMDIDFINEFEHLNSDVYNEELWFKFFNINKLKGDVNWNLHFKDSIRDNFEKFNSIELNSIFLTRFELDFEYNSNPLNMGVLFLFIFIPFHYFIDDIDLSWNIEEFSIYLPETSFNTFFEGYDAAVLNNGTIVDFETFTWSRLFYNDFYSFFNKFFNIVFDYGLTQMNWDYIIQPFNSEVLLIDSEFFDSDSRFENSLFINEDAMENEFFLPSEEIIFQKMFNDLLLSKPIFYTETLNFFKINDFFLNFKFLINYKHLFLSNYLSSLKDLYMFKETWLLNIFLYLLNDNLFFNNIFYVDANFNNWIAIFHINKFIEQFLWFDRFFFTGYFFERVMLSIDPLLAGGEIVYSVLSDNILDQKIYNWYNMVSYDIAFFEIKDFYEENVVIHYNNNYFLNFLVPNLDLSWLIALKKDNLLGFSSKLFLNSEDLFFDHINYILRKFLFLNFDIIINNVTYINSSFFNSKKEQSLWLIQWWLNNKEIYWNFFDLNNKNFNIFFGLFNFFSFFFMYIILFIFILIFFFNFKFIFLKKKIFYKKEKKLEKYDIDSLFFFLIKKKNNNKFDFNYYKNSDSYKYINLYKINGMFNT